MVPIIFYISGSEFQRKNYDLLEISGSRSSVVESIKMRKDVGSWSVGQGEGGGGNKRNINSSQKKSENPVQKI